MKSIFSAFVTVFLGTFIIISAAQSAECQKGSWDYGELKRHVKHCLNNHPKARHYIIYGTYNQDHGKTKYGAARCQKDIGGEDGIKTTDYCDPHFHSLAAKEFLGDDRISYGYQATDSPNDWVKPLKAHGSSCPSTSCIGVVEICNDGSGKIIGACIGLGIGISF